MGKHLASVRRFKNRNYQRERDLKRNLGMNNYPSKNRSYEPDFPNNSKDSKNEESSSQTEYGE